jgi:putative membrane protein
MSKSTVTALCLIAAGLMVNAQTDTLNSADREFLKSAATINMTEAHLGKMAQDQAADNAVKSFGERLVNDHTKAYDELSRVADKSGEPIPKGIDIRQNKAIEELTHDNGATFDRQFVHREVQDQRRAVAEFKREVHETKNAALKAYAHQVIPTLEEHVQKAEELEKTERTAKSASARHAHS